LGIFLFTTASIPALEPPTSYPLRTRGSFPGVKRPGREADRSPPSGAEVKNERSNTSNPQYTFRARCSVKTQGQLYLLSFIIIIIIIIIIMRRRRICNIFTITNRKF
jgi:hypothetical protein